MKKKIFISMLFAGLILVSLSSCKKKSPLEECTTCTELNSGYTAPEYCGSPSDVDDYIDELYYNSPPDQDWT